MRRFMVLPLAGLLALAVTAPVAAGPNVHNTSGGGRTVYADLSSGDTNGGLFLAQENGEPGWGEYFEESGTYVECEPGGEPEIGPLDTDPGDGSFGFVGSRTFGWAYDVQISFTRRLETGSATGQLDLWTETVDECAGVFEGSGQVVAFDLELTGTGSLVSFRGHGSAQVPSEFNGHANYRGRERQATGSIDLGDLGSRAIPWAVMSEYTWTEHVNS